MQTIRHWILMVTAFFCICGCVKYNPLTHNSDVHDAVFERRHGEHGVNYDCDPMMNLAREVTCIEDDIRRDGSITIKTPDVWSDGNLVHYIQEYERVMAPDVNNFDRTLQGYIVRSDQMEVQSITGLSAALGGPTEYKPPAAGTTPPTGGNQTINNGPDVIAVGDLLGIGPKSTPAATPPAGAFEFLKAATAQDNPPLATDTKFGIEPTELQRQKSVYLHVNQALRRRNTGDDQIQSAGYALYLFRVPVSVIPGRETSEGYSAVANLRAKMHTDEAHLKYTYPKLAIAESSETLTELLLASWGKPFMQSGKPSPQPLAEQCNYLESNQIDRKLMTMAAPAHAKNVVGNPVHRTQIYGDANLNELQNLMKCYIKSLAKDQIENSVPKRQELQQYIYTFMQQIHDMSEENGWYSGQYADLLINAAKFYQQGKYNEVAQCQQCWVNGITQGHDLPMGTSSPEFCRVGWLLGFQVALLDLNLKKILEEMALKKELSHEEIAMWQNERFCFFDKRAEFRPHAVRLWEAIIRREFPLHVFALDPEFEEQNVYDAFARRREMQMALAFSVATGRVNTAQKVAMSRQVALDMATIGLNRTVVGFTHGEDTFGWYFNPRVQSPPTESSNIGALARTIWSTGPTEHYDMKHRKLEPGIRECEVLIAMPSFITEVRFDVTSNWEKLTEPGVTKKTYEEMLQQGQKVHFAKMHLQGMNNQNCYRPGDFERLLSRVDQLENMLGMQTHKVNLPFNKNQTGSDLFSSGKQQLAPELTGYYGIEFLDTSATGSNACFFITGKHFHPTLTHVIVGGTEVHSIAEKVTPDAVVAKTEAKEEKPKEKDGTTNTTVKSTVTTTSGDVEVISRELIRVRVPVLNNNLFNSNGVNVRVGTPAGLSNPLLINAKEGG